ncbi:hypothetical protein [Nocardioides hungaricus]
MTILVAVDESKARNYLLCATTLPARHGSAVRRTLKELLQPGQRALHFKDERDDLRHEVLLALREVSAFGIETTIIDAGRQDTELVRRQLALEMLVGELAGGGPIELVIDRDPTIVNRDRQQLIELTREHGLREQLNYRHASRYEEPALWIPDALAWCFARGGEWRRRARPLITRIIRLE